MSPGPSRRQIVIIDDSPEAREALREILEADGDIAVVGDAGDGEGAIRAVTRLNPDLVTMDIAMPGIGGLAAIEQIMARCPKPILVVTGLPVESDGPLVFEAIGRGALDVAEKPALDDASAAARLRAHVRRLAGLPVVRHVRGLQKVPAPPAPSRAETFSGTCRAVGIAASAGGPAAIAAVLAGLPRGFPGCVAVVQHLPPGFAETFARFLAGSTRLNVSVVRTRAPCLPGTVLIAPDEKHLVATSRETFVATDDPPVKGHRPSATALFRSLAAVFGNASAGVVLSGIGDDGAEGLAEMRDRGALTLAQDEKTSAVYGMPAAAVAAQAVERVLALEAIAPALVRASAGTAR